MSKTAMLKNSNIFNSILNIRNNIFLLSLFLLLILPATPASAFPVPVDPNDPALLSQTMECEWGTIIDPDTGTEINDPEDDLVQLVAKLENDPVKIYNWVYENIEFEDYESSRKGARATYLTKRGNEWDQCSLLIGLLRLSGSKASYGYSSYDNVIVIALLPTDNYRGQSNGENKQWIPLVPWKKDYLATEGIDLFPAEVPSEQDLNSNGILDALEFDFDEYLSSIKKKTALEFYEEQLQQYLNENYPGKTLKDIPYLEEIVKKPSSILPASFPKDTLYPISADQTFAEIPNDKRISVTLYFYKYPKQTGDLPLLERTIYLPQIAGKRFNLDFIPATTTDEQVIAGYGGMCNTPDNAAQIKPVLKIDGIIITEGAPIFTGEEFSPAYEGGGYDYKERPAIKAGTFIQMAFDQLSAAPYTIEEIKIDLQNISFNTAMSDDTREEYLGRIANILITTYLQREYIAMLRASELLYLKQNWGNRISPTFIYTFPSSILSDEESKLYLHPQWNIDAQTNGGWIYKANEFLVSYFEWIDPYTKLYRDLYMYGASMNEGLIFEDWQDTPGLNTVKGIMVANENGIPVVVLTAADIVDDQLVILEDQPVNPLSPEAITNIKNELVDGQTVTTPVQTLDYEGMTGYVYLSFGPDHDGYLFNMDHGGMSSETVVDNIVLDPIDYLSLGEWYTFSDTIDIYTTPAEPDSSAFANFGDLETETTNSDTVNVGDPIDLVTGEYYQEEAPDFFIKSRGFDLSIVRTYRSRLIFNGPFGYGWTWNHAERVLEKIDGDITYYNNKTKPYYLTDNGDGTYTYPPGTTFVLEKTGDTFVVTHKNNLKYYFDSTGHLTRKEDPFGNYLEFIYNAQDQLETITDSLGRSLTFTYNGNGKVERVDDFIGRYCEYIYDGDDLKTFIDLGTNTTTYDYLKDQENPLNDHNMTRYTLPNGDFLEIGYYKNDQVAYHRNKKGEVFNFQYSRLNKYGEIWNEEGHYRKVFFNDNYDVIRITTEDKTVEEMTWDEHHNKISHTDANGNTTFFDYGPNPELRNLASKRIVVTENEIPRDEIWQYAYDPNCNKVSLLTDPEGNKTKFEYDPATCFLTKKIEAFEAVGYQRETIYTPDDNGNVVTITDPYLKTIANTYDPNGLNIDHVKDKNENLTHFTYYTSGKIETVIYPGTVTDPEGNTTRYEFDNYNQKTKETRDYDLIDPEALNLVTEYQYTDIRQLKKSIEPNGAVTEHIYDIARDIVSGAKVIETKDALGKSAFYEYDAVGNLIKKIDRNGNATIYAYDGLNRLIEEVDPFQNSIRYRYDGNGNLVMKTDKRGSGVSYFYYNEANRKICSIDPEGQTTWYLYYRTGKLKYQINHNGVYTYFEYDPLNRLQTKTFGFGAVDGEGNSIARLHQYEYDHLDRLIKTTFPDLHYEIIGYDDNGNKTSVTNYDSNHIKLNEVTSTHNSRNLMISMTDANGNFFEYEYDSISRKEFEYDPRNPATLPKGKFIQYAYDTMNNPVQVTDQLGNSTQHFYDLNNRRSKTVNALGHEQHFSYDNNGNLTSVRHEDGNVRSTYYDALNRKVGIVNAIGATTTFDYDENGNLIAQTDPLGNLTRYEYNKTNQLMMVINAENKEKAVNTYDSLGRLETVTDARGGITTNTYTIFNELKTVTRTINLIGDTVTESYAHDNMGRQEIITDARNFVTRRIYDPLGRVEKLIQAEDTDDQAITDFEYDGNGNVVFETVAKEIDVDGSIIDGVPTEFRYTPKNQLWRREVGFGQAQSLVNENEYDDRGLLKKENDPRLNTIEYIYDSWGRNIEIIDAEENSTTMQYDSRGNLVLETRPEGEQTFLEHDALNRLTKVTLNGDATRYTYDAAGRMIEEVSPNGTVTVNEYDSLGRKITVTEAKGTIDEIITRYAYDDTDNLISIISPRLDAQTVYDYDLLGRLISVTDDDSKTRTIDEYDGNGNVKTVTERDGTVVEYSYDSLNRKRYVTSDNVLEQEFKYDKLSRMTLAVDYNTGRDTHSVGYEYDDFNRTTAEIQGGVVVDGVIQDVRRVEKDYDDSDNLNMLTYPSALVIEKQYTPRNSLDLVWDTGGIIADFDYDLNNRIETVTFGNSIVQSLSYDAKGQEETRNYTLDTTTVYGMDTLYDPEGNIDNETIRKNDETISRSYGYDNLSRLIKKQQAEVEKSWMYDKAGNRYPAGQTTSELEEIAALIPDGYTEYEYDWNRRLVTFKQNRGTIAEYTYDALNRRVTKHLSSNATTINYVYDSSQVIEEYENDTLARSYVYGAYIDDPIAIENGGSKYYYIKDRRYSITALADETGSVVESYDYTPFGRMTVFNAAGDEIAESTTGNPYGFTGRRWDAETGLWYYRNRMYSPTLGRFLQPDPAGYVDGINLYAYVRNNPLVFVDPEGLTVKKIVSGLFDAAPQIVDGLTSAFSQPNYEAVFYGGTAMFTGGAATVFGAMTSETGVGMLGVIAGVPTFSWGLTEFSSGMLGEATNVSVPSYSALVTLVSGGDMELANKADFGANIALYTVCGVTTGLTTSIRQIDLAPIYSHLAELMVQSSTIEINDGIKVNE